MRILELYKKILILERKNCEWRWWRTYLDCCIRSSLYLNTRNPLWEPRNKCWNVGAYAGCKFPMTQTHLPSSDLKFYVYPEISSRTRDAFDIDDLRCSTSRAWRQPNSPQSMVRGFEARPQTRYKNWGWRQLVGVATRHGPPPLLLWTLPNMVCIYSHAPSRTSIIDVSGALPQYAYALFHHHKSVKSR